MHGKFILFHSHRLDHFHKCLDRKGIMLHGHRKFLFGFRRNITGFQQMILLHDLLGISDKFSPLRCKHDSAV